LWGFILNRKGIIKFFSYKLLRFIILMIAVAIFSFILLDLSPINPVTVYLKGAAVSEAQRTILNQYFGVGVPLHIKIYHWLLNLMQGDLGTSLIYRAPVIDVITQKFIASLALMTLSWIFSGIIGFALGVVAGKNKGSWIDKAVKVYCYAIQSAPSFWVGMLILMVFAVYLGLFPIGFGVPIGVSSTDASFMDWASRLVLPTLTLSLVGLAPIAMYTRNELIQVLSSDYVLFAKSRGEKGWNLVKNHGIRNILLPAITLQFLSFSELFGGAVLVEQVFSYPGIGQTAVAAGLQSDVPLFLGIVLFSAVFVFVGNLLADISYYFIDPRIKENEFND
jgi:peptide/nickel transport system permease protein